MKRLPQRIAHAVKTLAWVGCCALGGILIGDYLLAHAQQNLGDTQNLRREYENRLTQLQNVKQAHVSNKHALTESQPPGSGGNLPQNLPQSPLALRLQADDKDESPSNLRPWRRDWKIRFTPLHEDELIAELEWLEKIPSLRVKACHIQLQPPPALGLIADCLITERRSAS